ncbi:MAG: hypothetical protein HIU84_14055 [Acidobacteria bacterium]|nr:hypothetical protein [Acidobacteriota bacterium]
MGDSGERERSGEGPFEESRVVSTGNDDPTKAENSFQEARNIPTLQILLLSESLATDGGLIAIADVSEAMRDAGLELGYRVVGGIAVMLHVLRTRVDIAIRSTGDADYGVPPRVLTEGHLVKEIEKRGYTKTEGNRWERRVDDARTATVDLLIPAYTSRARSSRQVGEVNTTEVPGLAEAFLAEPCVIDAEFVLTSGEHLNARVVLPDSKSMILLKAGARRVRSEDRDATDLWRCLEVANADGVIAADFEGPDLAQIRDFLHRELGRGGTSLSVIVRNLSPEAKGQTTTRIQALLGRIIGV